MTNMLASGTERSSTVESMEPRNEIVFIPRRRGRDTSRIMPVVREPQAIPVTGITRSIDVKIASTRSEWEQAYQLAASSYQSRGYETPGANRLRFTPYHALPDTITLVAKHEDVVVATLSIVQDNTLLGLPMEDVYGDEIATLRRAGRRLLEFTTLADEGLGMREFVQVFVRFMQVTTQYHKNHGGDACVIAVNPRHRQFYTRVLGFVRLGPLRAYAAVQEHPAEAFWIDEPLLQNNSPRMYEAIFGELLTNDVLCNPKMPPDLIRQFSRESLLCDPEQIERILAITAEEGSTRRW